MKELQDLQSILPLKYSKIDEFLYGRYNQFSMIITEMNQSKQFSVQLSIKKENQAPKTSELEICFATLPEVKIQTLHHCSVFLTVTPATKKNERFVAFSKLLEKITLLLQQNHYVECCQITQGDAPEIYLNELTPMILNEEGYQKIVQHHYTEKNKSRLKNTGRLSGLIGGLLGSLIGVAVIVLFAQFNFISSIGGIVLAITLLKGYEWLSHRFSILDIILTTLLAIGTTYIAYRLDWSLFVSREVGIDIFTAFQLIPELVEENIIETSTYSTNFIQLLIFTAIGYIPYAIGLYTNMKYKYCITKLS